MKIISHAEKYVKDFQNIDANNSNEVNKVIPKLEKLHTKYKKDSEGMQSLKLTIEVLINKFRIKGMPEEEEKLIKLLKKI